MLSEDKINELVEQAPTLINKALESALDFYNKGLNQDAEFVLKQILRVDPNHVKSLQLMGLIRHNATDGRTALEYLERALTIEPDNADLNNNIALCYSQNGEFDLAITHLEKAAKLNPISSIYANLGLQYRHIGKPFMAIQKFKSALWVDSKNALAHCMLAGVYGELLELSLAEEHLNKAIEINPDFAGAHVDLGTLHALHGNFEKFFEEYEYRNVCFTQTQFWTQLYDDNLKYVGQDLQNKRILLYCEQGCGDAIQFVRYIYLLKSQGAYTIIHCQPELETLFKQVCDETFAIDPNKLITDKKSIPIHDYHISLLSLPYVLKKIWTPYFPYLKTLKSFSFDDYQDKLKIGIVWAGNPQHPHDSKRSCKLINFESISNIDGVKLFSLQKDIRKRTYQFSTTPIDLTEGAEHLKIVDLSEFMNNFEDTAALINGLDLIICVDTAVLHLAGALNKPTIAFIPKNPDWRWKLDGDATEWYPSVTLIRGDDWDLMFKQVAGIVKGISRECILSSIRQQLL